jgi:hypothetical protein
LAWLGLRVDRYRVAASYFDRNGTDREVCGGQRALWPSAGAGKGTMRFLVADRGIKGEN